MAKNQSSTISSRVQARDKATMGKIVGLADDLSKRTFAGKEPVVSVPMLMAAPIPQ